MYIIGVRSKNNKIALIMSFAWGFFSTIIFTKSRFLIKERQNTYYARGFNMSYANNWYNTPLTNNYVFSAEFSRINENVLYVYRVPRRDISLNVLFVCGVPK